ncbi:Gfo/Idh/MocA family oxidoreductase [Zobellella maritima]|uniref:Gfo/Idh/MocA family oxidoreductase n=1 Tax=Zobellella maritima TaxID=2059725 RepID=UPI000E304F67|nr:Gfo/Idh/MocA family oxidoreductase [Zobellella maritima]
MIWLIGCGQMSIDYSRVLEAQNQSYLVIGRGKESAENFELATGKSVVTGGLESFLMKKPELPIAVIVSVGVEQLYSSTVQLLEYGVKSILVEKPGALIKTQLEHVQELCRSSNADVFIAYNRRFFASTETAREMIARDGGATSFNFEFTEWSHVIEKLDKPKEVLENWFLANSTHVTDLAFFLGGAPKEVASFTSGSLPWHQAASSFAGAGISETGALFNYAANWESAGRWSVEVLTKENRYVLRPMESLQVQKRGTIPQEGVEIDDKLDRDFKPGLYKQVQSFLKGDYCYLCDIHEQSMMFDVYEKIAGHSH